MVINRTNLILCNHCQHYLTKVHFAKFYSHKAITKRWCDVCLTGWDSAEDFAKKAVENKPFRESDQRCSNHVNSEYSKQKRANKKRFEELHLNKFSDDEWDL